MKLSAEYFIAINAIIAASKAIKRIYNNKYNIEVKKDGSPVTNADFESSKIIEKELTKTHIPITGEETIKKRFKERKKWKRCWCVDPLDGTKEFIRRNGEFAVNIALIENQKPIFGLIASPLEEKVLFGEKKLGAFFFSFKDAQTPQKWKKLTPNDTLNTPVNIICSRYYSTHGMESFINALKVKHGDPAFVKKGSSLKFFDLALGKADVYPRFAPTMEWDIASGQAILNALGGEVIDAETKKPLIYNKENLKNPSFIATTKALSNFFR